MDGQWSVLLLKPLTSCTMDAMGSNGESLLGFYRSWAETCALLGNQRVKHGGDVHSAWGIPSGP